MRRLNGYAMNCHWYGHRFKSWWS